MIGFDMTFAQAVRCVGIACSVWRNGERLVIDKETKEIWMKQKGGLPRLLRVDDVEATDWERDVQ